MAGSAALVAARASRDTPIVVRDPALGRLVLDREHGWFETKLVFRGRRCELAISQSGATDDRARDLRDIARAQPLIAKLDIGFANIHDAIARRMLPLYNDTWRGDRRELSREQLLARVRLQSIVTEPRGGATLYFAGGRLFHDHLIEVSVGPRGGISTVGLSG